MIQQLESVVIRFCGDSGDGMQLAGGQFTSTSALFGNDIATFPDFPAEIRAPKGTTFGVSGFQVHFSSNDIRTPGDVVNAMVAMNPAGFKTNIEDVEPGGLVIVDEEAFDTVNLKKCGYPEDYNPLNDEVLTSKYNIVPIPMSRLTRDALAETGLGAKDADRCRNMFALGVAYWVFNRPLDATIHHIEEYYGTTKKRPEIADANVRVLKAGYFFGETAELFQTRYTVEPAALPAGTYRRISGNEAAVLAFGAVAAKTGKQLMYASYPITPASDILHGLSKLKHLGVMTFQAEDEIAAVSAAIGASFAGAIGVTGTSGPGLALKSEAVGLAVICELPLIVVDVQRAGPATGMPTKTEQADLLQAMHGRPGEAPVIIVAPQSPADCFDTTIEAARLALRHMCPVIILSDGYIANGAEPWRVPDAASLPEFHVEHPTEPLAEGDTFRPYERDPETLGRPWALPGTPGYEHRLGSLEKADGTGAVSYDPENHEKMVRLRAEKVARAADAIPPLEVRGPQSGETLMLAWGGTWGAVTSAADQLRDEGHQVSSAHLRYLNPFPSNLEEVLRRFQNVIVPEINTGQLCSIIRSKFLIDARGINQIRGRAFAVGDLKQRVLELVNTDTTIGAAQ